MLSLLLFNIGDPEANSVAEQYLAHILANRIRSTDEVGWFDSKHIGVILPYTSTGGAHKLADDICKAITSKASPLEYIVYTYPSNWFSNGSGHPAQSNIVDLSAERKTTTSQGLSALAKHIERGSCMLGTQLLSIDTNGSCGAFAKAIEPFFLQPLPVGKRAVDVVCASFGLVVLSPLLLLVALIIKIVYGGPVIFKQQRVGYAGRVFTMWKFRTMKHSTENSIHQQYMSRLINGANNEASDRPMTKLDRKLPLTGFGKILRATSVDELPQLINVLCGEMSLIGPRPPINYEVEDYSLWHYGRFEGVPGMSGLWQVSGKNRLTFLDMVRLDIQYVRKISLSSEVMILLKTPLAIFSDIRDRLT
jgi:lipopolysaccharide/colanic/teichoic acid biosynthesis glycosyltransferase